MTKKQVRNPRIFVDTPADLKRDYERACRRVGVTMSEDLRGRMAAMVRYDNSVMGREEDEQKEPA